MSRQSSLPADPSRRLLGIDSISNILPTRAHAMRLDFSVDWITDGFDSCWNNWSWISRGWIFFRLRISVHRINIFVLVFT
jgi:hypothetical protein